MIGVAQRGRRVGVEVLDLCLEIRWLPDVLIVEERNELVARQLEAVVTGASRAAVSASGGNDRVSAWRHAVSGAGRSRVGITTEIRNIAAYLS